MAKSTPSTLPRNWRKRLPHAGDYYHRHVEKLSPPNASGNASGCCPFHTDRAPSLSVQLDGRGLFKCHGCGEHGDLIQFHMTLTGLSFARAVRDLMSTRS
ncbi:CHC2 zinc finger domain-containing protein [Dyella silvae]|uniref:CHC2 zinc finger domain-containing protein n=1 Tax=Dyella silvae TaxID=2994424 RepID=UPI0031F31279